MLGDGLTVGGDRDDLVGPSHEFPEISQGSDALSGTGVHILADEVACRARGIRELAPGVCLSDLDHLADKIADGFDNILWY